MNTEVKKSWFRRHPVLSILGVIVVIIIVASTGGSDTPSDTKTSSSSSEQKTETIKVSAETLRQAYKEYQVGADNTYKGKLVEITGSVETIGKDTTNEAYVTFQTTDQYAIDHVQCMFPKQNEGAISTLKKGDSITVQGTVSGTVISGAIVRNCKVVSN